MATTYGGGDSGQYFFGVKTNLMFANVPPNLLLLRTWVVIISNCVYKGGGGEEAVADLGFE